MTGTRDHETLRQRLRDAWAHADRVVERAIADHPEEPELRQLHGAWHKVTLGERSGGGRRSSGFPLVPEDATTVVVNDPALRQKLKDAILPYHNARLACLDAGVPVD